MITKDLALEKAQVKNMAKEDEMMPPRRMGSVPIVAALLIMIGMLGGAYMLSQADFAPKVNVTGGPTSPTVYVSSTPPDHAISVSATASQDVAPDELDIGLRVQTQSSNAKQAQQDNAAVAADLRSKLAALGIADSDIQTVSYSVTPVYESSYICDKSGMGCHYDSNLTGYQTTQSFVVKMYDLSKGGDVIDAASTAGTNQTFTDYVQFTLKDSTRNSLETALLQNASASAKTKAQAIATGLGVSVGNVLSASESFSYPVPYYRSYDMMAGAAAPAAPTQLNAGQVSVSATVTTSFAVGS